VVANHITRKAVLLQASRFWPSSGLPHQRRLVMARPKKPGLRRRDAFLNVRVTIRERVSFDRAAAKMQMPTSAWARQWMRHGAHLVSLIPNLK
jgi:hypothetical protein